MLIFSFVPPFVQLRQVSLILLSIFRLSLTRCRTGLKLTHVKRVFAERAKTAKIDPLLESQFQAGRLYASISSRPGQSGRADGYVLEGKELEFYLRRLRTKKQ